MADDVVLDPAHADSGGVETAVAGIAKPDAQADPEIKVSEDGNVAEHKGVKYIRQEALHQERQARQQAQQRLKEYEERLTPLIPEINEYIQTKQNRQDRARQAHLGGNDDPEYLDEIALAMGAYDQQNQPDRARAQIQLNIMRKEAERAAAKAVEPVAAYTKADRAAANRERARGNKFSDGKPVAAEKYINTALEALGDEHLADPNVANLAQVVAAGLEYLDHRRNGTLPGRGGKREPMHTEGGGYRGDFDTGSMSSFDLAAARARGKTPEQWAKLVHAVNKGSDNLEDV